MRARTFLTKRRRFTAGNRNRACRVGNSNHTANDPLWRTNFFISFAVSQTTKTSSSIGYHNRSLLCYISDAIYRSLHARRANQQADSSPYEYNLCANVTFGFVVGEIRVIAVFVFVSPKYACTKKNEHNFFFFFQMFSLFSVVFDERLACVLLETKFDTISVFILFYFLIKYL